MISILAFDIATKTGVAYGTAGETPRFTSIDLGKGLSDAERFAKMITATRTFIRKLSPDVMVYEAPIGGGAKNVIPGQLAACAAGEAFRLGVPVHGLNLSTIRKHFLGKALSSRDFPGMSKGQSRTAIKRTVIARCKLLGWDVTGDDQADACALWDYAGATLGRAQAKPLGGLFNG